MMVALTLKEIARHVPGRISLITDINNDPILKNIVTDTRKIQPGDLYVALKGERFDGNRFVADAAAKGAVAAIVSDEIPGQHLSIPHIAVQDTRAALGLIARINRRAFQHPLIAITGSAGKTTTKNMLAAILATGGDVLFTQGNYNNEIGVPLTLLRLESHHHAAVIEMGAARRGDIDYLCQFAEPNISVLTDALPAHIEGFGSLDVVAETKGEIFQSLSTDGIAIMNADSCYFSLWKTMANCKQWTFGFSSDADFSARNIESDASGSQFLMTTPVGEILLRLPVPGRHSIANALAAAAAAIAAGANLAQVKKGLQSFIGESGRLTRHVRDDGLIVIDDTYNANPGSVKAAIDVLINADRRKILALGHMAELGADAQSMHIDVAEYAAYKGVNELWLVGEYAEVMAEHFGKGAKFFDNRESLAMYAQNNLVAGDTILVKGSRSAKMEAIVHALLPHLAQEELH